jgi:REP element-mobilizing transposase RayT
VKYQYTLDFPEIENQESAMSRRVRLEYAGACYHVINRGNYRRDLFAGKGAAQSFQACLGEAVERFGWRVHAFVIMRNHFHLAAETPEPNLSLGMKWLQGTWAARFNRFRGEAGRPFQGRYRALHVEPGEALGEVAHYIHLNPVRAKVLPVERLLEYRWSSLPWLVRKPRSAWLVSGTVLAGSGGLADTPAGWRSYLGYLAVRAEESADAREAKFGRLSQGWALGSADFQADLLEQLSTTTGRETGFDLLGADRQAHQQVRSAQWERALRSAAKALGIQLDHLPAKKSAAEKVRLAALMTQRTSVCNAWLADRLQMGVPGAVTQYVRRFRLQGETQTQSFQTALLKIHT